MFGIFREKNLQFCFVPYLELIIAALNLQNFFLNFQGKSKMLRIYFHEGQEWLDLSG